MKMKKLWAMGGGGACASLASPRSASGPISKCVAEGILAMLLASHGPKFLHFHAVFGGKKGQIVAWCPLRGWFPPLGNPGSATGLYSIVHSIILSLVLRRFETKNVFGTFYCHFK